MTKDIQDLFVLQMQQSNNNKIISTFRTMIFCFKCFGKKIIGGPMVHYSCTLVDIRHMINLRWLTLIQRSLNTSNKNYSCNLIEILSQMF